MALAMAMMLAWHWHGAGAGALLHQNRRRRCGADICDMAQSASASVDASEQRLKCCAAIKWQYFWMNDVPLAPLRGLCAMSQK
jgi:hypothetical protein